MSNFTCPTCGLTNIDCGKAGYKTAREIELEKKLKIAQEALEFYANKENNYYVNTVWEDWENDEFATVNGDIENGYKARQALEKIKD